jgi:hypothetical protein
MIKDDKLLYNVLHENEVIDEVHDNQDGDDEDIYHPMQKSMSQKLKFWNP